MNTLLKASVLSLATFISAHAAATVKNGENYGDWQGICEQNICGVQQVFNNKEGKPVSHIIIRKVTEAKNAITLFITLPLGVNLRSGVAFAVDNKEIGVIPYDFCTPGGCSAASALDDKILTKLKAGGKLQVATFVGKQQQTVEFSLKGITKALSAL